MTIVLIKKMKKILFISAFSLLFFSCNKSVLEEEAGTVRDFTGLDGCGLLIVLDNGKNLEPVSIPAGVTLTDGRRVIVKYRIKNDRVSACMAGYIVEITSLRYL